MAQQNVHLHGARGSHDDVHFLGPFFTARYDPGQSYAHCVHDVAFFRKVGRCSQIGSMLQAFRGLACRLLPPDHFPTNDDVGGALVMLKREVANV